MIFALGGAGRKGLGRQIPFICLGLILSIEVASAQVLTPTGCSLNFTGGGATAQPQYAGYPGSQYFTSATNTIGAQGSAIGTSVASAEASTSVVTELVAERRNQEVLACPAGYEKIGGLCQPLRPKAVAERRAPPKSNSMTSLLGRRPTTTVSLPSQRRELEVRPETQVGPQSANSVWSEALYDYEHRSGLGTALAPASRSQQTSELLLGGDHTFKVGDGLLLIGGVGSLDSIKQTFNNAYSAIQGTNYLVTPTFHQMNGDYGLGVDPSGNFYQSVQYNNFPDNHSITNQEEQTLKGGAGGITASIIRGGFFADGIFKAEFLDLDRSALTSDTYDTKLTPYLIQGAAVPTNPNQTGCISVGAGVLPPGVQPYTLGVRQTFYNAVNQGTTAANFILAENLGYHFAVGPISWVEPLVGGTYTYSAYGSNAAALGLQDGQDIRLQAGVRLGLTTAMADQAVLTASFTQIIYSDVYIHGFVTNADAFSAGYVLADQGKIRGQSIATAKLNLPNGLSFFLQCQGRYGNDYWAVGGRVGGRYEF